ncbi:MAG: hypothetical protein E6I64_01245 [Chloroflexi bacterium]|nr:MAG: hypothetical protein E6I64_01245 [Chloroflexota bacterium]
MRAFLAAFGIAAIVAGLLVSVTPARAAADFDSAYLFESAYLGGLAPGDTGSFAVFFNNTGNLAWTIGTSTQVNLVACRSDKITCNVDSERATWNDGTWPSSAAYAPQTKVTVPTGDFTSFFYGIKVPVNTFPGTYRFNGDLAVAATGVLVHPEGYYHEVSVIASAQQAPSDLGVNVFDANSSGGPNDVRSTFTAPRLNTVSAYEIQRRDGACPANLTDPGFIKVATATVSPGQTGSYVDLDRPNGSFCYQVAVKDPLRGTYSYSNQATATVVNSTFGVGFTSTSAVLTQANNFAPGRLFTGDSFTINFTLPVKLTGAAVMRFADSDCGAPASQGGPPATCASGMSQTVGDVTCTVNANCILSLDNKTLNVSLTAAPNEVAIGTTTGLQYPVIVIESHGITDTSGNAWDLANSADRVIGPIGQ